MGDVISVIVPIYRVEAYLKKCLDSILSQSYTQLEIILVDDGSPDCCGQICDEYSVKDSRIKVIHKENGGLSDARNAGLDIMTGDFVAFIDSDDWIEPQWCEKLLQNMIRYSADISLSGIIKEYETENGFQSILVTSEYGAEPFCEQAIDMMRRFFKTSWVAWDKLYKAELFRDIRYPVGVINEDEAIVMQLLSQCERVCYTNEVCYHYIKRNSNDSITMSPFTVRDLAWKGHCAANLQYVRQYYPELENLAAKRYCESLMWHITKISLLDDCSMYQAEINQLMKELKNGRKLFDSLSMDTRKRKWQYFLATRFGYTAFRTLFRLKQGRTS